MIHNHGNGLLLDFAQSLRTCSFYIPLHSAKRISNVIHTNGLGKMGKDLDHCFREQYIRGNRDGEAKREVCKN
jgi:hypothetical protein